MACAYMKQAGCSWCTQWHPSLQVRFIIIVIIVSHIYMLHMHIKCVLANIDQLF